MRKPNLPRTPRKPVGSAELPPLPKAIVEELASTAARPMDARWFTAKALEALGAGDAREAFELATSAKQAANRSPTVREIRGVAAYLTGDFKEALSELQAFRRLTNSVVHDARIADCYRGLGRPLRAVEFLDQHAATGPVAALVRAGALQDAGDPSGAGAALRLAGLGKAGIPPAGFVPPGMPGSAPA